MLDQFFLEIEWLLSNNYILTVFAKFYKILQNFPWGSCILAYIVTYSLYTKLV